MSDADITLSKLERDTIHTQLGARIDELEFILISLDASKERRRVKDIYNIIETIETIQNKMLI